MCKHHVIITGTGRAGTTFLVELLTRLGLDTGFTEIDSQMYKNCNAGLEKYFNDPNVPYIIKNPSIWFELDELITRQKIHIDHAYIPIRDLYAAAESRRAVEHRSDQKTDNYLTPGGLIGTSIPDFQESILTFIFYELIHTLTNHDIPMTFLNFPRIAHDPVYLYNKLTYLCNYIPFNRFQDIYYQVVKPELIHNFI